MFSTAWNRSECCRSVAVEAVSGHSEAEKEEEREEYRSHLFLLNTNYVRLSARLTYLLLWFSKLTVFELILELKLGA